MIDNADNPPAVAEKRYINWVALAAGICLLGEIAIMSRYKPSLTQPPPISVLLLSLLTLFLGAGSLLYRLNRRQYWFTGRAIGVISMLLGMIIFSVQSLGLHKDREVLLEKQLKIVAGACVTYARSHLGRYPPNLAALLETGLIKPAYLSDPTNVREPLVLPSDWRTIKPAILIHAINANSDFRYVGQDLRLPAGAVAGGKMPPAFSRIIILYSNEQQASSGLLISSFQCWKGCWKNTPIASTWVRTWAEVWRIWTAYKKDWTGIRITLWIPAPRNGSCGPLPSRIPPGPGVFYP